MPHPRTDKCWASPSGGCGGGWSKEHYFSEALLEGNTVKVWGMEWNNGAIVEIPKSKAMAGILCKKHNEELSELDQSIKQIKDAFKAFYRIASERFENKHVHGEYIIDGSMFERWILKTTINSIRMKPKLFENYMPDWYSIDVAYGRRQFDYGNKHGLYMVNPASYGHKVDEPQTTEVRPLLMKVEGVQYLFGAVIRIFGMYYFLKMAHETEGHLEIKLNDVDINIEQFFHPQSIGLLINEEYDNSVMLKFSYDSQATPSAQPA